MRVVEAKEADDKAPGPRTETSMASSAGLRVAGTVEVLAADVAVLANDQRDSGCLHGKSDPRVRRDSWQR
jgi:hypothetical protein